MEGSGIPNHRDSLFLSSSAPIRLGSLVWLWDLRHLRSAWLCSLSVCSLRATTSSWVACDSVLIFINDNLFWMQILTHSKSPLKEQLMSDFRRSILSKAVSTSDLVNFHIKADLIWSLFLEDDIFSTILSRTSLNWSNGPLCIPSILTWINHGSLDRTVSTR